MSDQERPSEPEPTESGPEVMQRRAEELRAMALQSKEQESNGWQQQVELQIRPIHQVRWMWKKKEKRRKKKKREGKREASRPGREPGNESFRGC